MGPRRGRRGYGKIVLYARRECTFQWGPAADGGVTMSALARSPDDD